jgi:molybdate transport system ATP-binding protein
VADGGLRVRLRQDLPVRLDVDLQCGARDVLAIFGPSGSGKTSILRAIAGLTPVPDGEIRVGDTTWLDTAMRIDVPPHRRGVGVVFQDYALFPHLDVLDNVMLALWHLPRADRRARAEALLARVHMASRGGRAIAGLSGGERQRVAVARALARDPQVLLLDEPFAAVDRTLRRQLQDEVEEIRSTLTIPVVLVTHDFGDVVRLATHLLLLDEGRAVASGPLHALASRADLPWLRDQVGLGSVIDAVVDRVDTARGLSHLACAIGMLVAPSGTLVVGTAVRVRIPAREVILAAQAPAGLSLHNVLAGTVVGAVDDDISGTVAVQVGIGSGVVLAEVTRDAIARLAIGPGRPIHVLVKSVSLDVQPTRDCA